MLDIYALDDQEFDELVDRASELFTQYCHEILFEQDKFLFKKIKNLQQNDAYTMCISIGNVEDIKDQLEYYPMIEDQDYFVATVYFEQGEDTITVARMVLSKDDGDESYVEFNQE